MVTPSGPTRKVSVLPPAAGFTWGDICFLSAWFSHQWPVGGYSPGVVRGSKITEVVVTGARGTPGHLGSSTKAIQGTCVTEQAGNSMAL